MSWRWRKSIGRGPFRINLTKRGIGYSVGIPGLRYGRSPSGKKYVSQSIPGTGLYRIKYLGGKKAPAAGSPPISPPLGGPRGASSAPVAVSARGPSPGGLVSAALGGALRLLRWTIVGTWRVLRALARRTRGLIDYIETRRKAGWSYSPPKVMATVRPSLPPVAPSSSGAPMSAGPTSSPITPPAPSTTAPASTAPAPKDPWWKQNLPP